MKKHTIINANDIHAALSGQEVQPLKKNKKQAPEGISLYDLANEIKNEEKAPAKKTRKTASKAAHKRAAEICKQLCFCFTVKPEPVYFKDINIQKYRQYLAQVEKDLLDGLQRLQEAEQVARYYASLVKSFSEFAQSHYDRSFQQTYFRF